MKQIITSLIAITLLMAGTALAHEFGTVILGNVNNETRVLTGLDSPQPDTIMYDAGSGQYFLTNAYDYWGTVRFTCPASFELRSVYVQGLNPYGNQDGCDVYIHDDNNGNPGALLGGPYHINGPFTSYVFSDAEVTDSLEFSEGDDFHVIYGPAPGGPNSPGNGWYLYLDGDGNTNSRSGMSSSQSGPWDRSLPGDLMVRAGGALETFTDIACVSAFTDPDAWFIEPGTELDVKAEVENVGTIDISSYTITYTICDEGGTQVWTESGNYGALVSGASQIQTASTTFTPSAAGYYELAAEATATGDANPDNDVHLMEQGVGELGWDWMKFDDGSFETVISFSAGNGWGQRFDPQSYPAQVDSIKVGIGGASTATDIRIFDLDPIGQTFSELWSYTGAAVEGWNTFSFDPDEVVVFEGHTFVVAYIYQEDCPMQKDDNLPIAAGNTNMPPTSYQVQQYGAAMGEDNSGDWAFRLFASESQSVPPEPAIATNTDTLDFGEVTISTSSTLDLWVYHVGGEQQLEVTNILITPPSMAPYYDISTTSFTLQQGDSQEVEVTFTPSAAQAYNCMIGIMNNAPGMSPYMVRVLGSGTTQSVHDPLEGTTPSQFSLAQNYPNPFNPSTEIRFGLPVSSKVHITIYNVMGQQVTTLLNRDLKAGYHSITWNAADVPSGIYFYRLNAGNFTDMKKMVLIK
jgi:hypothetical protein